LAARVYTYVTGIVADVKFLSVSLMPSVPPGVGAGVIPAIGFLVQLNVVPAVSEPGL
jgi:hypothetical protein